MNDLTRAKNKRDIGADEKRQAQLPCARPNLALAEL